MARGGRGRRASPPSGGGGWGVSRPEPALRRSQRISSSWSLLEHDAPVRRPLSSSGSLEEGVVAVDNPFGMPAWMLDPAWRERSGFQAAPVLASSFAVLDCSSAGSDSLKPAHSMAAVDTFSAGGGSILVAGSFPAASRGAVSGTVVEDGSGAEGGSASSAKGVNGTASASHALSSARDDLPVPSAGAFGGAILAVACDPLHVVSGGADLEAGLQQPLCSSPGSPLEDGEVSAGTVIASSGCAGNGGAVNASSCWAGNAGAVNASSSCSLLEATVYLDPVLEASPRTPSAHQVVPGSWNKTPCCDYAQGGSCTSTVRQFASHCCSVPPGAIASTEGLPTSGNVDSCTGAMAGLHVLAGSGSFAAPVSSPLPPACNGAAVANASVGEVPLHLNSNELNPASHVEPELLVNGSMEAPGVVELSSSPVRAGEAAVNFGGGDINPAERITVQVEAVSCEVLLHAERDRVHVQQSSVGNAAVAGAGTGGEAPLFSYGRGSRVAEPLFVLQGSSSFGIQGEGPGVQASLSPPAQLISSQQCPLTDGSGATTNSTSGVWTKPPFIPLPRCAVSGGEAVVNNIVQLDMEAVDSNLKKFKNALVGRLFGRKFPFFFLNSELHKRWDRFGKFKLTSVNADCFICFFDDSAACDAILSGGPWIISGQVLGLDRWSPSFSPSSRDGLVTPIWVRMPGLPFYCWDTNNIARITSYIGDPLWIDVATDRLERGSFARACVRLDLSKPLKNGAWIQGLQGQFFQPFEYEGISSLCFRCGCVGHKAHLCGVSVNCSEAMRTSRKPQVGKELASQATSEGSIGAALMPPPLQVAVESDEDISARGVGPWVLVVRRQRRTRGPKGPVHRLTSPTVRRTPGERAAPGAVAGNQGATKIMGSAAFPDTVLRDHPPFGRATASFGAGTSEGCAKEKELACDGGGDASPLWPT